MTGLWTVEQAKKQMKTETERLKRILFLFLFIMNKVKSLYHTEKLFDVFGLLLCYANAVAMIPFFTVVTSSAKSTNNLKALSKL
jgi:hypothetical protein